MTLRNRILITTAALSFSVAIAGGVFAAPDAAAPDKPKEEKRAAARQGAMKRFDNLDLSAEQKEKIQVVMQAHRAKLKGLTPEQRKEQGRELNKNLMVEIGALLTPEQRQKMQEANGGAKARVGGAPMAKFLDELNLTAEQKEKITPILEDSREEAKKIQADQSLTPKLRGEKMRTLTQDTRSRIQPILTAEQVTKLDAAVEKSREEAKKRVGERKGGGQKRDGNKTEAPGG